MSFRSSDLSSVPGTSPTLFNIRSMPASSSPMCHRHPLARCRLGPARAGRLDAASFFAIVPPSPPSHWRGGAGQAHRRWKMCDGWPAGPAPSRFYNTRPTKLTRLNFPSRPHPRRAALTARFGKFVAYYRVSTDKQGQSGLGLDAQRQAVMTYLNGGPWKLIAEYTEVETAKRADRPELQKALAACRKHKAKLVIAKLDR